MLFVLAELVTFGFITLLQFLVGWHFVLALLAMHSGIALFIISKKRFHKLQMPVRKFYRLAYVLLALYLPVLICKLLSRLIGFVNNENLVMIYVLTITSMAILISVWNTAALFKFLKTIAKQVDGNPIS